MSNKIRAESDIEIHIVESGDLSTEDIDAVADFIAYLAYNNLKRAQESADHLIKKTLNQVKGDNGFSK